jgi:hypothetical protein
VGFTDGGDVGGNVEEGVSAELVVDVEAEAVKVVDPVPQIVRFPETVGAGGDGFTVIVTEAQDGLNCPPLLLFT